MATPEQAAELLGREVRRVIRQATTAAQTRLTQLYAEKGKGEEALHFSSEVHGSLGRVRHEDRYVSVPSDARLALARRGARLARPRIKLSENEIERAVSEALEDVQSLTTRTRERGLAGSSEAKRETAG